MIACDCEVCRSEDPRDKRLRSSLMVETDGMRIVVDTGPDFREQMLRHRVRSLDAVLFTHPHKDHIAGLDDVRAFNHFMGRPMDLYANHLTEEAIRRDYHYAFSDSRYPGIPELAMHSFGDEPFMVGDIEVVPINVWHLRMPVVGFRFGDLTYITDANRIDEEEKGKIRGSRVLILNALRRQSHVSHFSLAEAVSMVRELEVPQAYFTHVSHQMGLHRDVCDTLPPGLTLAHDGLMIELD
jgi:phosphoribosyl 1,2-cyclic phosphate phosphodiesterase